MQMNLLKRMIRTFKKLVYSKRNEPNDNDKKVKKIYYKKDFLTAYKEHSNLRAKEDPKQAIGGQWEKIGKLQFNFLLKHGLEKHNSLLDYGCGSLRGGRYFIRYLDEGCYTGIDISEELVKEAKELIKRKNLNHKKPRIILNDDLNLSFEDLEGDKYDFILAQSVFTHLQKEHIEEVFKNLPKVMHVNSVFFFTANIKNEHVQTGLKTFAYPVSFFENLATRYGFHINQCDDYEHPRDQVMFKLSLKQ